MYACSLTNKIALTITGCLTHLFKNSIKHKSCMRKFFILILLFSTLTAIAQQKTITGKVVDEKNAPVAFATVKIKKTNAGVSADAQGSFTINAAPGDVLVVSATGMVSKEATVGTQNNITVTLNTANTELSAVVVTTALGISARQKISGMQPQPLPIKL